MCGQVSIVDESCYQVAKWCLLWMVLFSMMNSGLIIIIQTNHDHCDDFSTMSKPTD